MLTSLKSCRSPCTWHCHHAAERDARVYLFRDVATQFARFESGGLQHLGYASREGLLLAERLLREWRLPDHAHRHRGSDCAVAYRYSRLNACVRVNGGHCEHKFWASDFLLCFVCFGDTGFCKCDRYKHVQSANIAVKCVTFVSDNFTRYGSNITNVWQDIFSPMTLAFSCEVVHEKFVKVTAKKSVAPFFWTRCTLRKLALLEAWTCLKR